MGSPLVFGLLAFDAAAICLDLLAAKNALILPLGFFFLGIFGYFEDFSEGRFTQHSPPSVLPSHTSRALLGRRWGRALPFFCCISVFFGVGG